MLRNARSIGSILRALMVGSAVTITMAATSTAIVSCADENQPETWVKKLNDPITRPAAIKRLQQFFEDYMTKANKDRNDPNVKALLDKIIAPMTQTYVAGGLDDKTRIELIKFLADTRDPRAKAAWIAACQSFADGKGASEDDVRWVAPAAGAVKLEDVAPALGAAFVKLQAGTQKGSQAYKNVHDAMVAIASPQWKGILIERISRPMSRVSPGERADAAKLTEFQNEQFWQTTSAEILGELRDASAVKPLFKALMNPQKADVAATASVAIVKIGKPAVPILLQILSGQDADVNEYAKSISGGNIEESKAHIRWAAVELGAIGRPETVEPLIKAVETADSDINRTIMARELTKFPATPASLKTFQAVYEKIAPALLIPPGSNARASLVEAASHFYDPQLVPWLLKQIKDAKGTEDEKKEVQASALVTVIKLMKKDQLGGGDGKGKGKDQGGDIKAMVDKVGTQVEKDAFKLAADVVNACSDNVGCYLSKAQEAVAQEEKTQFIGIKAAYMLGILGNAGTAMDIAKQLPKIRHAAVRFSVVSSVDHLAQKDTGPVADALQKVVDADKAKEDRSLMMADAPVKEIIHRLRAR